MKRSQYLKELKKQVCKEAINTSHTYYNNVGNNLLPRKENKPEDPIFIDDLQVSIEVAKNLMSLDYILCVMQVISYRKKEASMKNVFVTS
ncbi:hypothetical protein [Neobacillus cucumis]|uniref:hypothetical protein n=1 Tax=Neobacillus cucumis TaxID=1740721 RepID=UPI002853093F|nr:hypothetical protein [Neobacillus cucumis]MDR4946021.1 hypothetical protein [Neobacillus cucumis]